jgi:serine/threonine protein phosphatase PrpC
VHKESMQVAVKTDAGRVRTNNEDSVFADRNNGIFLLADGMGGHRAGEVASDLAVKTAYAFLLDKIDRAVDSDAVSGLLMEAVLNTHNSVREKSLTDSSLSGMGTTLVIMVIKGHRAYICHVGDSRAYLIRKGIRQITVDHTFGDYLDRNMMMRGLFFGRRSRVLAQAVGTAEDIEPDLNQIELHDGDMILLCSDGLTDMLPDDEIERTVNSHVNDMNMAVNALIEEANNRGGRDNISVVLVKVG